MNSEIYTAQLPPGAYQIDDPFWAGKMETVRTQMIPYQWKALNDQVEGAAPSHCIKNFKIAAGMEDGKFEGRVFQDSDVAKWLEAVGYVLSWHKDEELERTADEVIRIIAAAQQPDGYLDTYYIINGLEKRWTNLMNDHELYCAGHMIEAGIAYYEGTGKRELLEVVIRLADCIDGTFGPEEGKLHAYPGHEIIEMALVRLYCLTKEERYLKLAKYFIDERGQEPLYFKQEREKYGNTYYWEDSLFQEQYFQAGKPVREQKEAQGHAVRAMYLYSGMASAAKETGDTSLWEACATLWDNVVHKQMYITGAVGSSDYGEAFTFDYDLPNDTVYGETCASIGLIFWARRMLEVEPGSEYADVMELALFNTCLSGMSLDGKKFFYVNPLEVNPEACRKDQLKKHVEYERQPWFECACCPPNLARLISSLGSYAVTANDSVLYLHLYVGGRMKNPQNGMALRIESGLPWDSEVEITVEDCRKETYELAFRMPGWADGVRILLNGEAQTRFTDVDGYIHFQREWTPGDVVKLAFDMPVRINRANPSVKENIGKIAVSRGPIVYCLEEIDNGDGLHRLSLCTKKEMEVLPGNALEGAAELRGCGRRLSDAGFNGALYAADVEETYDEQKLHFIPYYLWNNRGIGEMTVWVNGY
ncbi:hypothetical protein C817_03251 [Dorea sp. 5-2]|nr:hypothetical protein C817_03251 [Dorea sp. 5-2]